MIKIKVGEFKKIYDPSIGLDKKWYINDHTIIKGKDGWHMFGITHEEPANPLNEVLCAHAFSKKLLEYNWERLEPPIVADRSKGEQHFWAPHVIENDGLYYMFWCAGNTVDHTKYQIMMATSKDLYHFKRCDDVNPIIVDGYDARDPMVKKIKDQWVLYYTCNKTPSYGNYQVAAMSSKDLYHWENKKVVYQDERCGTYAGPCESPFVIEYKDKYLLFIGPTEEYDDTSVIISDDPFHFEKENTIARIPSHASEIIVYNDKYYITRAGWGRGGLYIAEIEFEDQD